MSEKPSSSSLLRDVICLVFEVDSLLDDGPFNMAKALQLRQTGYDLLKRLEDIPVTSSTQDLNSVVRRAFSALQNRLSCEPR